MRKKKNEMAGGEMPQSGPTMKTKPPKGEGMDMGPDGELVQVKAHKRHKGGGTQGHPAKAKQPLSMRFMEGRD